MLLLREHSYIYSCCAFPGFFLPSGGDEGCQVVADCFNDLWWVDLVREGFDCVVRVGALGSSSLLARLQ